MVWHGGCYSNIVRIENFPHIARSRVEVIASVERRQGDSGKVAGTGKVASDLKVPPTSSKIRFLSLLPIMSEARIQREEKGTIAFLPHIGTVRNLGSWSRGR